MKKGYSPWILLGFSWALFQIPAYTVAYLLTRDAASAFLPTALFIWAGWVVLLIAQIYSIRKGD